MLRWGLAVVLLTALAVWYFWPPSEVAREEAEIFATDDAQWFGADPVGGREIVFYGLGESKSPLIAILDVDGRRVLAGEGDLLIPPCVSVHQLLPASLLLDVCGAFALLSPYGQGGALQNAVVKEHSLNRAPISAVKGVHDLRGDAKATRLLREYRERLYESPLSLRGRVDIKMDKRGDGERRYFIFPGDDQRIFDTLPLQQGDRIHAVNGVALSESEALSDLYTRLDSTRELVVTLEKDGRYRVVLLSL